MPFPLAIKCTGLYLDTACITIFGLLVKKITPRHLHWIALNLLPLYTQNTQLTVHTDATFGTKGFGSLPWSVLWSRAHCTRSGPYRCCSATVYYHRYSRCPRARSPRLSSHSDSHPHFVDSWCHTWIDKVQEAVSRTSEDNETRHSSTKL